MRVVRERNRRRAAFRGAVLGLLSCAAHGASAGETRAGTLFALPDMGGGAQALSVSGDWVVGIGWDPATGAQHALLWDAANPAGGPAVLTGVGEWTSPYGVSGDRIVGRDFDEAASRDRALLWDASNPAAAPVVLGDAGEDAWALGVDGDWIVGWAEVPWSSQRAALWDASNPTAAPTLLADLGGMTAALSVSGDRIVGWAADPSGLQRAALWDASDPTGAPTLLGDLGEGSVAFGVSGDWIAGYVYSTLGQQAALWNALSPSSFALLAGGEIAYGVGGNRIVGTGPDPVTGRPRALLWDAATPTAPPLVLDHPGGGATAVGLTDGGAKAAAVSGDWIVGSATDAHRRRYALLWSTPAVPEPSLASLALLGGGAALLGRRARARARG